MRDEIIQIEKQIFLLKQKLAALHSISPLEKVKEQTVIRDQDNMPGVVIYQMHDGEPQRKSSAVFGPGDDYCSIWSLLNLAGLSNEHWAP